MKKKLNKIKADGGPEPLLPKPLPQNLNDEEIKKQKVNSQLSLKQQYSEKLKHPKWQKKRLEIMQRDNFTCRICGDTETTLNIHHLKYINSANPWDIDDEYLITLCEHCHKEVEEFKKEINDFKIGDIKIVKGSGDTTRLMMIFYNGCLRLCKYENDVFIWGLNLLNDLTKKLFETMVLSGINDK